MKDMVHGMKNMVPIFMPCQHTGGIRIAAILRVVQKDAGILLASLKPEEVLEVLNRCPVSVLKRISACNSGSYEMHV